MFEDHKQYFLKILLEGFLMKRFYFYIGTYKRVLLKLLSSSVERKTKLWVQGTTPSPKNIFEIRKILHNHFV